MTTLKTINKAIATYGVELVKGNGYFYFADTTSENVADSIPSVYSMHLRGMSLDQWVNHVSEALCTPQA